ncbi:hypothetical protein FGO68_gene8233 [Halteria grandinella]|uniref:Uncharacterized protein n=1 Tax=Halteria grandinella TaxID=5974 RepID=A0A8J8NE88_HALGN|nr:hypothetical protein FGO68_gene8233 [Halteria grandinella]
MFPRLASKYLTLQIVGYAFFQPEAVELGYLCHSYRQLLIRNYQLFKKALIKAEKKVIYTVFELLDERWLSKRYRLSYIGQDFEKDVADCLALLGDRLHFHSIAIPQSLLPLFSKFRPIKMEIEKCKDIPQLFKLLPHSVADLTLYNNKSLSFEGECGGIRKFRKLKLLNYRQTLDILSRFATATESLTIEDDCLWQPGVMEYLAQMDCKQIIVKTKKLLDKKLQEFFSCQSKAIKFIDYSGRINYSQIEESEWASNYFSQKCLDREIQIDIYSDIDDAQALFETLFNGAFKLFKHKRIELHYDIKITLNCNICFPNGDTHTQSLDTGSLDIAVLALNNCTSLTRLEKSFGRNCEYQQLLVEKLPLQELIIIRTDDSSIPLIRDILNKSKDTLSYLQCDADVDLSSLRNSTQLTKLKIDGYNIDYANLKVIRTFTNLQELETTIKRVVGKLNESKTLKILRWLSNLDQIDDLPQSVTKVISTGEYTFDQFKQFLEKNPYVKELEAFVSFHTAAQLFDKFKHVNFNFIIWENFFTFKQCYTYLHHPECMQVGIPGTEPDHVLYELLFKRIEDKKKVLRPYFIEARIPEEIEDAPPEMMEWVSTFNEFKNCLRKQKLDSSYFERVFNRQMLIDDDEYLGIIVNAYDEVFQLSADIDKTVTILKAMDSDKRKTLKRERFFHHCRNNWIDNQ